MIRITYFLVLFLFIGGIFSCKCKKKSISKTETEMQTDKQIAQKNNSFKILLEESNSNIKEAKNAVITNLDDLRAVYAKINSTRRPGLPIPDVDFTKETVLGIFLGEKTHAGYTIKVDNIVNNKKETVVYYRVQAPKGPAAYVITQPALLVSIPKTKSPIRFEMLRE